MTPVPGDTNITIGPSFFEAFNKLPGAQYVLQVPLVRQNLASSVAFAKAAFAAAGPRIQAVEIGNEPDLYPTTRSNAEYVALYQQFDNAIVENVTGFPSGPFFQAPDTSSIHKMAYPA